MNTESIQFEFFRFKVVVRFKAGEAKGYAFEPILATSFCQLAGGK